MANNKTKIDRIHDQMPRFFKTRTNPNWKALIEALGQSDENISNLVEEVRKQFFVKTATRPYLDKLGANVKVSRPRFIGMDDPTFKTYIPVLAYQPKQVKLILDDLLDIFFFKETTTAFSQTEDNEPFHLVDGWELEYVVDQTKTERIQFNSADFVNIGAATAEEIVSAINRQSQYSFAIVFDDRIKKKKFIRLFTNTIGSKGSIQISGGRADIALRFRGFNDAAGSGSNTQWLVTKIGDTTTFQHVGGVTPNLNKVQAGNVVIISIPNNQGSFIVTNVDLANNSFTFVNLFSTAGTIDHGLINVDYKVRFMDPEKIVVFTNSSRSVVWEVTPGEIIVEMPATPPVVKRSLIGSAHINGVIESVINRISDSSLELQDATEWPMGGEFILQEQDEIQTHILTVSEDIVITNTINARFDANQRYTYTSKSGNILSGITPNLPTSSDLFEATIFSATRTLDIVTITTTTPHGFTAGEGVRIQNVTPDTDNTLNGTFTVLSTPSPTTFTYHSFGATASSSGGVARVERSGMSNSGSLAYLTSAIINSGIYGPYMWDPNAAYVISSATTHLQTEIKAGNNVRTIQIDTVNTIPNAEGFIVFDFGTEREEGPVRYLYKPTTYSMQVDPSYVFNFNHDINSSVTVINRRGPHVMSGLGTEYPAYITDPTVARQTLEQIMLQVKSVGIFIDFLVRYPEQLYSQLDVYSSGNPNLWPINDEQKALLGL